MNYEELLIQMSAEDDRIMVLTAENRAAIRNIPGKLGNHFVDTGITEQTMVGMAAGLALRGRRPVTHALAAFLTMRAFEFIRTDLGIPGLPVKLVGGVPGFLSEANGPTHQAIEDISLMRTIPNMNIFCPADEEEMVLGMKSIIESDKPFYVRYNSLKRTVARGSEFEIGKAALVKYGEDVTILTYGMLLTQANEASELLESKGISVRLINLRTLKPIDEEIIIAAAEETSLIVTLEDHFITGGLYSILGELFLKHHLQCNVLPIALGNRWFKPALLADVLEYEGFTGRQIAETVHRAYEEKSETINFKSLI